MTKNDFSHVDRKIDTEKRSPIGQISIFRKFDGGLTTTVLFAVFFETVYKKTSIVPPRRMVFAPELRWDIWQSSGRLY